MIALLAAACDPPPPLYPRRAFDGPAGGVRLGLVGHSVPNSAHAELRTELRLSRVAALDTMNGWTIPDAAPAIDWLVAQAPDVAVVDLGENEVGSGVSQATLRARVRATLDRLAAIRCVVWVDIPDLASTIFRADWKTQAEAFNAWLPGEAASRPNTHPAGWADWSRPHREWFLADGLHLVAAGRSAYAAFVHAQVNELCGGPTARNPVTTDTPPPRGGPPEVGADGSTGSSVRGGTEPVPGGGEPDDPVTDGPDPEGQEPEPAPSDRGASPGSDRTTKAPTD